MLTSQMTSISSRSSLSPFTIQTTTSAMHRRPQLSSSPRAICSRQQTRNFRFGLWASILKPQQERRAQLKQKCVEAMLSRKPRKYQHLMRDYLEWRSCGLDATDVGKRWVSMDALLNERHRLSKMRSSIRPGERQVDETPDWPSRSFCGKRWSSTAARWRAEVFGSLNGKEKADGRESEERAQNKTQTEEYEYDPVSNRMVPKKSSSLDETTKEFPRKVPISTFKGYRSQFADLHPPSLKPTDDAIHLDGPPAKSELGRNWPFKYSESGEPFIDPELPPEKEELDSYKPFKYNEPDGKSPEEIAAANNAPPKEELENYKAFRYNEPDGHAPEQPDPVSESLKAYESRPRSSSTELPASDSETSFIGTVNHPESEEFLRTLKLSDEELKQMSENNKVFIDPQYPDDTHEYKGPYKYNEPDGHPPEEAALGEQVLDFPEDTYKYQGPFKHNEPDGHPPEKVDTVAESLKEYDSKPKAPESELPINDSETSYIGARYLEEERLGHFLYILEKKGVDLDVLEEETDGYMNLRFSDYPDALKELDEIYEHHGYYTSDGQWVYRQNGPSSARVDAATDGSKDSNLKDKQSSSDFPDDAHKYETPYRYNEPDGHAAPKKSDTDFPDDAHKYETPYKYNEPDGQAPNDLKGKQSSSDFPDDAYKYETAYRYNEPDGQEPKKIDPVADGLRQYDTIMEDVSQKQTGQSYDWVAVSGDYGGSGPEFPKTPFVDEPQPTQDELRRYNAYRYQEPDGHAPQKADPLVNILKENYHLSGSTLPQRSAENRETSARRPDLEELKSYKPFRYNEPDGKAPEKEDSVEKIWKLYDAQQNETWLSQEGFSAKKPPILESPLKRSPSKITAFDTANRDKAEDLDLLRTSDVRAASGITKSKTNPKETDAEKAIRRKALDADFKVTSLPGDEIKKPTANKLKSSVDGKRKMTTGCFVRDFPEEFSTTWSNGGSALVPADAQVKKVENKIQQEENDYAAGLANQDAYTRAGSSSPRIQTSLDRSRVSAATKIGNANADELYRLQAEVDPYSKEPQGLETSYAEEIAKQGEGDLSLFVSSYGCGDGNSKTVNGKNESSSKGKDQSLAKEVREIYEDTYGPISPSHRQGEVSSADQPSSDSVPSKSLPNLYKVLAFEPSTQSVQIAETTSITPDTSNPLTPAEALMRLSNPAKFFPHFEPLRSEGYEIISGGGDVLVFRKVRDTRDVDVSNSSAKRSFRNPVDGMSPVKPATGNFASPTGFVNYDLPPTSSTTSSSPSTAESEEASPPPFKSNIDVRREEPVFSGRRNWEDENEYEGWKDGARTGEGSGRKKRTGTGKRVVVGAGMVGGACYAVGVVAEWFRTGGIDGVGTGERF